MLTYHQNYNEFIKHNYTDLCRLALSRLNLLTRDVVIDLVHAFCLHVYEIDLLNKFAPSQGTFTTYVTKSLYNFLQTSSKRDIWQRSFQTCIDPLEQRLAAPEARAEFSQLILTQVREHLDKDELWLLDQLLSEISQRDISRTLKISPAMTSLKCLALKKKIRSLI